MRRTWILALALLAPAAHASSVFFISQGTVTAAGSCAANVPNCPVTASYGFIGPGLSTSGISAGNGVDFAQLAGNTYIFQMLLVANGPWWQLWARTVCQRWAGSRLRLFHSSSV